MPVWVLCMAIGLVETAYLVDLGLKMAEMYRHFDGEVRPLVYTQVSTALMYLGSGVIGACTSALLGARSGWKPWWVFGIAFTSLPAVMMLLLIALRLIGLSEQH